MYYYTDKITYKIYQEIIIGRIQKGRQKMSIFTPFSLYSIVVIAAEYAGIMAVAQW